MPIEVRLPQLADAMTAVKVGAWLKREGDRVASGEPIVEVETDKTNVEIEAPASGVLQRILIAAGSDGVTVGALLATIVEARESTPAPARAEPEADSSADPVRVEPEPVAAVHHPASDRVASLESAESVPANGVSVTPLARKMAKLAGVDLATIRPADGAGRGPGRIGGDFRDDRRLRARSRRGNRSTCAVVAL
jgi:pyruvate/2-oxoglutarate dehydrogenase complex dihydrolipoamide acyltransferase (E2) component